VFWTLFFCTIRRELKKEWAGGGSKGNSFEHPEIEKKKIRKNRGGKKEITFLEKKKLEQKTKKVQGGSNKSNTGKTCRRIWDQNESLEDQVHTEQWRIEQAERVVYKGGRNGQEWMQRPQKKGLKRTLEAMGGQIGFAEGSRRQEITYPG